MLSLFSFMITVLGYYIIAYSLWQVSPHLTYALLAYVLMSYGNKFINSLLLEQSMSNFVVALKEKRKGNSDGND